MEQERSNGITPPNFELSPREDRLPQNSLRRHGVGTLFILCASLAACQNSAVPSDAPSGSETETAAVQGPDAKPGMSARDGRLVLAPVADRPAAAYFTLRNAGNTNARLVGIEITGTSDAQMHRTEGGSMERIENLDIAPGVEIAFAPGGMHVMAFGLGAALKPGATTEMTLTFSDGDKLSTPLRIEGMGESMGNAMTGAAHDSMEGMHH